TRPHAWPKDARRRDRRHRRDRVAAGASGRPRNIGRTPGAGVRVDALRPHHARAVCRLRPDRHREGPGAGRDAIVAARDADPGDPDQLDVLKSLPVKPAAIVVAQLIAPTLVLTICQIALFIGAVSFGLVAANFLLAAALIAVPLNALVFAIENLLFLLFPVQMW